LALFSLGLTLFPSKGLRDLFRGETGLFEDLLSKLSLLLPSFFGEGDRGDLGLGETGDDLPPIGGVLENPRRGGLLENLFGGDLRGNLSGGGPLGPPFLSSPTSQSTRNLRPSKL